MNVQENVETYMMNKVYVNNGSRWMEKQKIHSTSVNVAEYAPSAITRSVIRDFQNGCHAPAECTAGQFTITGVSVDGSAAYEGINVSGRLYNSLYAPNFSPNPTSISIKRDVLEWFKREVEGLRTLEVAKELGAGDYYCR